MNISKTTFSFTGGEWAPALYARPDLSRYFTSARQMSNVVVHPFGGFSNRAGLEYIGDLPNSATSARLVPFQFNAEQNYVLVLTPGYIHYLFLGTGGYWGFVESGGSAIYNATDYSADDLDDLDWAQSADSLYLFHPTKGTAKVVRKTSSLFGFVVLGKASEGGSSDFRFGPEVAPPQNISRDEVYSWQSLCIDGIYQWTEFAGNLWCVEKAGGGDPEIYDLLTGQGIYEDYHTSSPTRRDAGTYYKSSADIVQSGAVWGEWYWGGGKGHKFKTLWVKHDGDPGANANNIAARCDGYEFCVTAVSSDGEESTYEGVASTGLFGKIEWDSVANASHFNIYRRIKGRDDEWGWVGRVDGDTTEYVSDGAEADKQKGPPEYSPDFGYKSGSPAEYISAEHGTFFDQRLVLGNLNSDDSDYSLPQTIVGSVVGFDRNYTKQSPIRQDDSFQFALSSTTINEIKWLRSLSGLIIGTAGGEWLATGDNETGTITPTTVNMRKHSDWGSGDVRPIVVGDDVLFVPNDGKTIRTVGRDQNYGLRGEELTLLARHLFEDVSIKRLAYQKYPDGVVWVVTEGGALRGLTYNRQQQVAAWTRHTTYTGEFQDVVSSPNVSGGLDDVLFVVKRGSRYQIEVMSSRFRGMDTHGRTASRGFFVDAGLWYSPASPAYNPESISVVGTSVTNLPARFYSSTVVAVVDGKYETVSVDGSGAATLSSSVSESLVIGWPYGWSVETQDVVAFDETQTTMNRNIAIQDVTVYYQDTAELRVRDATDTGETNPVRFRLESDASWDTAEMSTGRTKPTPVTAFESDEPRVVFYGDKPVPVTVNAVVVNARVG